MTADRDPLHLFPEFREKHAKCLAYLNDYLRAHHPGMQARMIEGFRSTARQQELYAQGRFGHSGPIVTEKNGTDNPSNHQSAMAADTGIFKDGAYIEEPPQDVWDQLRHAAHVQGLVSGGDWHGGFKDWPHVEWPATDIAAYKQARAWKQENGLV